MPQIELTQKQYGDLLRSLTVSSFVVSYIKDMAGVEVDLDPDKMINDLLSQGADFGYPTMNDLEQSEWQEMELFPQAMDILKEYDDFMFWERLASDFAERDLASHNNVAVPLQKEHAPQIEELASSLLKLEQSLAVEEKYHEEFEKNGLDNVYVKGIND
ncbi:MAG: hypothetical protein A2V81_00725 [Candidatus Abawacabacteria bacterium RBG_16_42_10]|uniref:Uncharacterized protein n=1 Tax=Candidatus Abawacabacteria bacterium RBG_16_42_10 TaxID=1817814 RepID=A0A1F4XLF5_9BACT|nr:MAG: hypothetical protein A2V81_00725 [Candidatus Abawacabacteria bacterium RBG_16_42_10]